MRFKLGVKIKGMKPELLTALLIADKIAKLIPPNDELIVTSVTDGAHMASSLHYQGLAADLRTKHFPDVRQFYESLSGELVPLGFDVIKETDHIHIEFDPK